MMRIITTLWNKAGSIHLTVVLCLLLTVDLAFGYICLNRNTTLFAPLNDIGLAEWMGTYGRYNLEKTAWFFILMLLLGLLCLNTFVCTTERVLRLLRFRAQQPRSHRGLRFYFRFAPHVMHYAVIIMLAGYLCSYLFAHVLDTRTLIPGASMSLPGSKARIEFSAYEPQYYSAGRLESFKDRVLKPVARLRLVNGGHRETAVLGYNRPVWFKGYGIFMKSFAPKSKGGMGMKVRINLSIRKDPGVLLYLAGMAFFTAGMALYVTEWIFFKKGRWDFYGKKTRNNTIHGPAAPGLHGCRLRPVERRQGPILYPDRGVCGPPDIARADRGARRRRARAGACPPRRSRSPGYPGPPSGSHARQTGGGLWLF